VISRLTIKNFALLKDTEIAFADGFTVITGETGAGKSLLVEALEFLGGGHVSAAFVRDGAANAVVEGEFITLKNSSVILRRELSALGRSRAFIDDRATTIKNLSLRALTLFDITSQRAFSQLLDSERHVNLLDLHCDLQPQRIKLKEFADEYAQHSQRLARLKRKRQDFQEQQDYLLFQLDQIAKLNPQSGEEEELKAEVNLLEHTEELHSKGSRILDLLRDDESAAENALSEGLDLLEYLSDYDPSLSELHNELESALITIQETCRQVDENVMRLEFDPERLEEAQERLHALNGLARKHGGSVQAMLARREELQKQLEGCDDLDRDISALNKQIKLLLADWTKLAVAISNIRHDSIKNLCTSVEKSLVKLGIKHAQFSVVFDARAETNGRYETGGKRFRLDELGIETVEFYFSANPGLAARALSEIASGGELSRLYLALKETQPVALSEATIIFDEIDTGVSGKVAHLVGEKLKELSQGRQMIAITHLPQIAAMASHHFRVSKSSAAGETISRTELLAGEGRVDEIASMLSGGDVTDDAKRQAENLLR